MTTQAPTIYAFHRHALDRVLMRQNSSGGAPGLWEWDVLHPDGTWHRLPVFNWMTESLTLLSESEAQKFADEYVGHAVDLRASNT